MNTRHYSTVVLLTWLISGPVITTLTIPAESHAQDRRRYDRREDWRRLEGTWYLNGERDKPCRIVATYDGLEASNERGETTRLVLDRYGYLRARDWEDGLRGEVRRQSIEWANGTIWTRMASRR
jgi:hypothetical protein